MLSFYGATRNETTAALVKSNERSKRTKCEFGFVAVITIWLVFWGLCVRILDGELEELVDITLDSELEELVGITLENAGPTRMEVVW